jgi:hypothetical protein
MMFAPSKGLKLTVGVSQIQLDPEDELTQNVLPQNVVYYIYQNRQIVGVLAPFKDKNPKIDLALTAALINDPNG